MLKHPPPHGARCQGPKDDHFQEKIAWVGRPPPGNVYLLLPVAGIRRRRSTCTVLSSRLFGVLRPAAFQVLSPVAMWPLCCQTLSALETRAQLGSWLSRPFYSSELQPTIVFCLHCLVFHFNAAGKVHKMKQGEIVYSVLSNGSGLSN